jgi:hypothetical protein
LLVTAPPGIVALIRFSLIGVIPLCGNGRGSTKPKPGGAVMDKKELAATIAKELVFKALETKITKLTLTGDAKKDIAVCGDMFEVLVKRVFEAIDSLKD